MFAQYAYFQTVIYIYPNIYMRVYSLVKIPKYAKTRYI